MSIPQHARPLYTIEMSKWQVDLIQRALKKVDINDLITNPTDGDREEVEALRDMMETNGPYSLETEGTNSFVL